ncbi:MAG: EF-hand domain-containing protein, partial [Planctomycetota bacterium]|nr:EF-hand domain-containing protein [Planctomycetota bacterium]
MSADTPENAPDIDDLDQDEPKKRNPAERILVWCTIGALLLLALMEARAQQGYGNSLAALQAKIDEGKGITLEDAQACMAMVPETSGPTKTKDHEVYDFKWFSLLRWGQFELSLRVLPGDKNLVAAYATAKQPDAELRDWENVPTVGAEPSGEENPDGEAGIMGRGVVPGLEPGADGGGPGGDGGPRPGGTFDRGALFDRMDEDKDGKLAGEEISERMAQRLEQIDTNKDGEITREEFLNAPPPNFGAGGRRPRGEGRPGEGRPGEGRPGEGRPGEGRPGEGRPGEGRPARPP